MLVGALHVLLDALDFRQQQPERSFDIACRHLDDPAQIACGHDDREIARRRCG